MLKKYIFVVSCLLGATLMSFGQDLVLVNPDYGLVSLKNAHFVRKIAIKKCFTGHKFY